MAKAKILVVEDEGIVAKDVEATLNSLGYDVPAIAFSGEEAIQKAAQTRPDLALMDIVLPGAMDGIETAEQIRSRFNIPIVYLTAYADDDTLRRAKVTESCGYILKPFEDRELRANIEMALYKHETESKLKASEKKYRHLAKSLPQTVFEMDEKGTLTFANREASEIFGYTEEDFANGLNALQMIAARDRDRAKQDIRRCLEEQRAVTAEYTALRKNRSEFPVLVCLCCSLHEKERTGLRGIAIVMTEYKRAEAEKKELEQKAQLVSRLATVGLLASGVGHEINNPLTGVIGYSELLLQKDLPEDIKKDLKAINEGAQRVADIVKKLVAFAHHQKPQRTYASINYTLATTLDLLAHQLKTSSIELTTHLDPNLPCTIADIGQLQQVFLNIIINAETEMKLARGKGNLFIETKVIDNTIHISFKDNGPGIAKKNLDRIFEPFFTTREVGEGTGLGLSICHGIVTRHGGRIYATSELDKGATFIVELPIVTEPEHSKPADSPAEDAHRIPGAKILVVEDDPTVLSLLSRVLTDEGHEVETVDNAKDALRKIKSERYGLILLDIKMPGMSAPELYDRFKQTAPSLANRVVFITGDVLGVDTMDFIARTEALCVTKPFDAEQLKEAINRILTSDM